jgi:hypothetical protein
MRRTCARALALAASFAGAVSCGSLDGSTRAQDASGPTGSGTAVAAGPKGVPIDVKDAVLVDLDASFQSMVAIVLADRDGLCAMAAMNVHARLGNAHVIELTLTTSFPPAVAEYVVVGPGTSVAGQAEGKISALDGTCTQTDDVATAGKITVTESSATRITGTYNLSLASGAGYQGTFAAGPCLVRGGSPEGGAAVCNP